MLFQQKQDTKIQNNHHSFRQEQVSDQSLDNTSWFFRQAIDPSALFVRPDAVVGALSRRRHVLGTIAAVGIVLGLMMTATRPAVGVTKLITPPKSNGQMMTPPDSLTSTGNENDTDNDEDEDSDTGSISSQESNDSSSPNNKNKDDILAVFGQQLNQGSNYGNNNNPSDNVSLSSSSLTEVATTAASTTDLNQAIQKSLRQKQIQPRTHG